jgi:uncharacterized protein YbbK (DUF523 family)
MQKPCPELMFGLRVPRYMRIHVKILSDFDAVLKGIFIHGSRPAIGKVA